LRHEQSEVRAILFVLIAITIWSGWMSATRVAATGGVAAIDVAALRYGVPAVMLAPVLKSTFQKMRHAPLWSLIAMFGWGLPFVWLLATALESASVVHLATIVFCTMPVFAVLGERLIFGTRLDPKRVPGFLLIGMAALIVILNALVAEGGTNPRSLLLMLIASAGWASYTIAFKHTGFSPLEGPAYVCAVSTLVLLIIKALSAGPWLPLSGSQLVFNGVAQGVLSGFVATILYTMAIERLGSARTASFSVVMPMIGTAIAYFWLAEVPSAVDFCALSLGTLGVVIVNDALRFR
jgi:drug/metabolite transporter (DMT)-like permease